MTQRYNTGNPRPSNSMKDLNDNALAYDDFLNSEADTFVDRMGNAQDSLRGEKKKMAAAGAAVVEETRQNLIPLSRQYMTLAAAQADIANIPDGATTYIRSTDGSSLADEYINNGGTLIATGRKMPSQAGVESLVTMTVGDLLQHDDADSLIFQLVDILGYRQFYALTSGEFGTSKSIVRPDGLALSAYSLGVSPDSGFYIENSAGQRVYIVDGTGVVAPRSVRIQRDGSYGTDSAMLGRGGLAFQSGAERLDISGPEFLKIKDLTGQVKVIIDANGNLPASDGNIAIQDKISILNNSNYAYYSRVRSNFNAQIERLVFELTHIIWYGQSLSTDQECWPALTRSAYSTLGNLMLGDSCRPASREAAAFSPVGGVGVFRPLKAVTQSVSGSSVLTAEEESALTPGASNEGEGAVAAINMLRKLFLQHNSLRQDPSRQFILSSCGVSGRTIEQLSPGATPELYNRVREAISQVKTIAGDQNKAYGIGAFCFLQGEYNYDLSHGGDGTRAGYRALMESLYSDFVSDFCSGQNPPAMFLYQTSGAFTNDTNELAIGMAQLDLATSGQNYFGVCPAYPFPDKGWHLTGNGARWMDMFFAKVMFRVLVLGEGWEPLHCTSAEISGNYALLNYAVPYPPLKWGKPYVGRTATDYSDKGFRATDESGELPILSVEIVADTVVKITFVRDAVGDVKIWYADKTSHNGNGCLCDSDPFISMEKYEYNAGSGQYADENITELVGKPYPLNNWAWAQVIYSTVQ
ncbi:TPA: hypothetical protein MAL55_004494 [Klebsiella pneumoniae]|nr:hypothetical protein [Klebsiella pneumoniae]